MPKGQYPRKKRQVKRKYVKKVKQTMTLTLDEEFVKELLFRLLNTDK